MKYRSTTRVYRIDNKESHHITIQILGFFLPLLHRFEEHDRTSANSPYTVPFFTGLRMLVAFLTPGCLSHLSSATVEGLRNISGCHCPQSSGILKVLIRIYTTPADQRGGMFQNLIWQSEMMRQTKCLLPRRMRKLWSFSELSMWYAPVLLLGFDNYYF